MSSDPKTDLIYAILAMDSYNRGYGAGIKGLDEVGAQAKIGSFSILQNISQSGWQSAGFYAIAYQNGDDTVISYRGTDKIGGLDGDLLNGWTLGGGLTSASQGKLALDFYQAVNDGESVFDAPDPNIVVTGHSLGGGLAGFVGSLAAGTAVGFDHMPFLAATYAAFMTEFRSRAVAHGYAEDILPTDALIAEFGMHKPSFENYGGIALEGEVNRLLRDGTIGLAIGAILGAVPYVGPFLAALGGFIAGGQIAGEQALGGRNATLSTFDWSRRYDDPVFSQDRHSAATLVIAKFAANQEVQSPDYVFWRAGGGSDLLYSALYDNGVGIAAGAQRFPGKKRDSGDFAGIVRTAIAYSALPVGEGERPFGDTGIWSMFDDAGDLGKVLAGDESAFFAKKVTTRTDPGLIFDNHVDIDVKQWLADVLVQYAGALALNDIEQAHDGKTAGVDVRKGVLALSDDNNVLSVDLSSKLWTDALDGHKVDPIDAAKFREVWFEKAAGDALTEALGDLGIGSADDLAKRFWGASDGHIIDRFGILTTDQQGGTFTIAPRTYDTEPVRGDEAHVDAFVATRGDDTITGTAGHDILVGNGGTDRIDAGAGNDVVIASGGQGSEVIGGLGRDIVYNNSRGGKVYGDTVSGYYEKPVYDANGVQTGTQVVKVEDDEANSDLFWFAPNVEIMDAQVHDRLVYHGYALTGGDRNPAYTFAFGGALTAAALGSLNALGYGNALGGAVAFAAQAAGIFFDKLHPNIVYYYTPTGTNDQGEEVGDLKIADMFDAFDVLFGTDNPSGTPSGTMVVHNFKLEKGYFGFQQAGLSQQGTLGMAFKEANPLDLALALTAPLLRASALTAAYVIELQTLLLVDYAIGVGTAISQAAKTAKWIDGADPLVIDLDGDGIETTSLNGSNVYFDVDGDLFRERTGWLKGDDGFLVLDGNGNGRIDDISEMFGGVGVSGFSELATLDSDHDGKITMADAVWADLRVWQDKNRDGVTQDGELKSLDQLGITELSLTRNPLSAQTSAGASLQAYGSVTFASGRVSTMFEAIFTSNDVDTKYAGENGLADWQAGLSLDTKGFGRITNLSVANDNFDGCHIVPFPENGEIRRAA